jgi:hypothetical protein
VLPVVPGDGATLLPNHVAPANPYSLLYPRWVAVGIERDHYEK